MENKKQNITIDRTIFEEITEAFRSTIFNQHNLLAIAKKQAFDENVSSLEALTISIDRFNDDLFQTVLRLQGLLEIQATEVQS